MKHHRRRLFVDSAFQGRLLLRLVFYWAIYHVALWHLLFLFNMMSVAMNHDSSVPAKGMGTLYREFAVDHSIIIICFLVMLPILGRDLLKFSHRMAGPLIRFRNTMQQMADGRPVEPVTLRKYDLPSDFLGVFNKMVMAWNNRIGGPAPTVEEKEPELAEVN
ncbi:MAG TPA: hypothetical protein VET25_07420 [Aestuariivirgaceae bacterium]|nr:hypothetical protein [Aestuariivirgaceae bacterium]